jgi:hypothetical protein
MTAWQHHFGAQSQDGGLRAFNVSRETLTIGEIGGGEWTLGPG